MDAARLKKDKEDEMERQAMERIKQIEDERQSQVELERQKQIEDQKKQLEMERQKEIEDEDERQRQIEMEIKKKKEIEDERQLEMERLRQMEALLERQMHDTVAGDSMDVDAEPGEITLDADKSTPGAGKGHNLNRGHLSPRQARPSYVLHTSRRSISPPRHGCPPTPSPACLSPNSAIFI